MQIHELPPAGIQIGKLIESTDLRACALKCELDVLAHGFCLAPKARNSISSLGQAPQDGIEAKDASAESAIHCKAGVSRAFSARTCDD
jgi:hypothetical protein